MTDYTLNEEIGTKKEEMETTYQQIAIENKFIIRSYSKIELAQLYAPDITSKAAVKKLNHWIALKPGLFESLCDTGMALKAKYYTPIQVRIIVDALEEP